jgi:tetratricopeptide (TPR) repeat protein
MNVDAFNGHEDALTEFQAAYEAQMAGRFDEAITRYRRSIALHPTAEAHTFLGWVFSWQGHPEDAIAECKAAIAVDPDFGNPYNDIGAYLIELSRFDEAIPWLERAKEARRYEPRHYPHFNLARVHIRRHRLREALQEIDAALALEPGYSAARQERHRILGLLN